MLVTKCPPVISYLLSKKMDAYTILGSMSPDFPCKKIHSFGPQPTHGKVEGFFFGLKRWVRTLKHEGNPWGFDGLPTAGIHDPTCGCRELPRSYVHRG